MYDRLVGVDPDTKLPSPAVQAAWVDEFIEPAAEASFIVAAASKVDKGSLVYYVKDYGAVGNGVANDTAAIESASVALSAAGGGTLHFGGAANTYLVSRILVRSNIIHEGNGATVKGSSSTTEGVFEAIGWNFSSGTTISNSSVRNFRIDGNSTARRGMFLIYATRVVVQNNTVTGTTQDGIRLHWSSVHCRVEGNHITLSVDVPFGTVPTAAGIYVISQTSDPYGGGLNDTLTFDVPPATLVSHKNIIKDNYVYAGTHGVILTAATDNVVTENVLEAQSHRGIILSPVALRNVISNNRIVNCGSSGIHMAYGCRFNTITGNSVITDSSSSHIEGNGIKGYYACTNNTVVGNYINGTDLGGIRFAMASGMNTISSNRIEGCGYGVHLETGNYQGESHQPTTPPDTIGIQVLSNVIVGCATGIKIDQNNSRSFYQNTFKGNTIDGSTVDAFQIIEATSGNVHDLDVSGTSITTTSGNVWTLPRGTAHFRSRAGNTGIVSPVEVTSPVLSTLGDTIGPVANANANTAPVAANAGIAMRVRPNRDMSAAKLVWAVGVVGDGSTHHYDVGIYGPTGTKLWTKGSTLWPTTTGQVTETVSPAVSLIAGTDYWIVVSSDSTVPRFFSATGQSTWLKELMAGLDGTYSVRSISSIFPLPTSTITLGSTGGDRTVVVAIREA